MQNIILTRTYLLFSHNNQKVISMLTTLCQWVWVGVCVRACVCARVCVCVCVFRFLFRPALPQGTGTHYCPQSLTSGYLIGGQCACPHRHMTVINDCLCWLRPRRQCPGHGGERTILADCAHASLAVSTSRRTMH